MSSMKRATVRVLLALSLLVPASAIATAAPAAADHDTGWVQCYELDVETGSHVEWHGDYQGWKTVYYDHYYECTDGHWYWWEYRYSWSQGYWYYRA